MWRENLEQQLLWQSPPSDLSLLTELPITCDYRAPPWSWTSSNREITWQFHWASDVLELHKDVICLIHIKAINIQPNGKDTLGSLQDARLHIFGTLFSAIIECSHRKWNSEVIFHSMNKAPIATRGKAFYDSEEDSNDEIKYILPIFEEFQTVSKPNQEMMLRGLILAPANDKERGHFRRLGVFDISVEWEIYGQLLKLLPREDCFRSRTQRLTNLLKRSSKRNQPVDFYCESKVAEVASDEDMHGYESSGAINKERIKFYKKGMKFYDITLV